MMQTVAASQWSLSYHVYYNQMKRNQAMSVKWNFPFYDELEIDRA